MRRVLTVLMILFVMICIGCRSVGYKHLTHDEARKMINDNPNVILLDVRAQDEYEKKHIPNSISLSVESLRDGDFSKIPDKNAPILTYCWTGRRAEDAAQILAEHGYKNVYELGGVADWKGELEGTNTVAYKTITQEEAMKILESDPNARLLDCRFPKDYELKHIPNAINFPLEFAVAENFEKIPDKNAPLITYCGDGNRGRLTAKVLTERGFTNVYTMGGIIDWHGPVEGTEVKEPEAQ